MADTAKCDFCQKEGCRKIGTVSPAGWFWAEVNIEDVGVCVIYACSSECAMAIWQKGPGKLDLSNGKTTPSK